MVTRRSYRRIFYYATNVLNKKQFVRNLRTVLPNSIINSVLMIWALFRQKTDCLRFRRTGIDCC